MTRYNSICAGHGGIFNNAVDERLVCLFVLQLALYCGVKDILSAALFICLVGEAVLVEIFAESAAENLFKRLHDHSALVLGNSCPAANITVLYVLFGVRIGVKHTVKGKKSAALGKASFYFSHFFFVHFVSTFSLLLVTFILLQNEWDCQGENKEAVSSSLQGLSCSPPYGRHGHSPLCLRSG